MTTSGRRRDRRERGRLEEVEALVRRLRRKVVYCRYLQDCRALSSKLDALQRIIEVLKRYLPSSGKRVRYGRKMEKMFKKLKEITAEDKDLTQELIIPLEDLARKGGFLQETIYNVLASVAKRMETSADNIKRLAGAVGRYVTRYGTRRSIRPLEELKPKRIVEIRHDGPLRILAFSDYRIHSIKALLSFTENLEPKPDIIIYAGDDLDRFLPPPPERVQLPSVPPENVLERMAKHARYGLFAITGNDDVQPWMRGEDDVRLWIRGEKVYEGNSTWLRIGKFLIVGQEGTVDGIGSPSYSEAEVALRLNEFALPSLRRGEKMIIVSHTPPRGVLDRAMRFGEGSIGSKALRDFIEEHGEVIPLVICGHVHRCGGKTDRLGGTVVVNVSSHDDIFTPANVALITVSPEGGVRVEFARIPSAIEEVLRTGRAYRESLEALKELGLSRDEAEAFLRAYAKHGDKLFEDLPGLATLKFRYGFAWRNVFTLYDLGVRSVNDITGEIVRKASTMARGIYKVNLNVCWLKVLREREKGRVCLINELPVLREAVVLFDTEYAVGEGVTGVLYGFYDLSTQEFVQFWFYEEDKLRDYVRRRSDALSVHYGGADKKLLHQVAGPHVKTFDLLYFVQTSLVAPISSSSLKDVFDALHGHVEDGWWDEYFYTLDGLVKNGLCIRVLDDPHDEEAKRKLANANKADVIALKTVFQKLRELPVCTI